MEEHLTPTRPASNSTESYPSSTCSGVEFSDSELLSALIVQRIPEFAAGRYWKLRSLFESNSAILNAPLENFESVLTETGLAFIKDFRRQKNHQLVEQAQQDLQWAQDNDAHIILYDDERYPELLKAIDVPPPLLFVRGNIDNLSLPQIAVVGSRSPTATGKENAFSFSRQLASNGFAITSGLALGIDAAAHNGALSVNGKTVAVFGTGIDKIYPQRHQSLAREILNNGGTLISEYPLGTAPQPSHFPRRNRIISGLSLGVLVVEAALKSGSLITARYALQQGREVFAIPGSIHNPLSRGCHAVIREGATLVEQVLDMQEPLQGLLRLKWQESEKINGTTQAAKTIFKNLPRLDGNEKQVWQALGFEGVDADVVCQRAQLDMSTVLATLITLELQGLVEHGVDGYQRIGHRDIEQMD